MVNVALALSELFDVVESDSWANLKPENGLDGGFDPKYNLNARERALKQVSEGKHPFSKRKDGSSVSSDINKKRIENGIHVFQNSETQRKININRINRGDHNFQTQHHKDNVTKNNNKLSSRPEYLELKQLYISLNIKQPKFLHMKSLEVLNQLKLELLTKNNSVILVK